MHLFGTEVHNWLKRVGKSVLHFTIFETQSVLKDTHHAHMWHFLEAEVIHNVMSLCLLRINALGSMCSTDFVEQELQTLL